MKKITLALCLCLSFTGVSADRHEGYNIVTGGATGTYIQIGQDLRRLLARNGRTLNVLQSDGSQANINDVFQRRWTPLGIVQHDVLGWIQEYSQNDPELLRIAETTRLVYPLYNEEIHILARQGINSLRDLSGKRVAIGKTASGTNMTASLLLGPGSADIELGEEVSAGGRDAVDMLKRGEIDAMFYVAGYPVQLFVEEISSEDNLHLLPLNEPYLREFYTSSSIPAGAYSWQPEAVPVVAVKAVLMTYEFDHSTPYRSRACNFVGLTASIIRENLDWLRTSGHPKWNSVNLNADIPGWQQARCVSEGRNEGRSCRQACEAENNPVVRRLCLERCATR